MSIYTKTDDGQKIIEVKNIDEIKIPTQAAPITKKPVNRASTALSPQMR